MTGSHDAHKWCGLQGATYPTCSVGTYLEGHTKSVLLIRGAHYEYWSIYVVYMSEA